MAMLTVPNHVNTLATQMYGLQQEGILCDVSLVGENSLVEVHSVVLASISSKLKLRMSRQSRDRKDSLVLLTEYSQDVLDRFVHFLYTGNIRITAEVARDLLTAFKDFKLTDAMALCEKFINEEVGTTSQSAEKGTDRPEDRAQNKQPRTEDLSEVTSTNDLVTGNADRDVESIKTQPCTSAEVKQVSNQQPMTQPEPKPYNDHSLVSSASDLSQTVAKTTSKLTPKKRKPQSAKSEPLKKKRAGDGTVGQKFNLSNNSEQPLESLQSNLGKESRGKATNNTDTRVQNSQLVTDRQTVSHEGNHGNQGSRWLHTDYSGVNNVDESVTLTNNEPKANATLSDADNNSDKSEQTIVGDPPSTALSFGKESPIDVQVNNCSDRDAGRESSVTMVNKGCYGAGSSKVEEAVPGLANIQIRTSCDASLWAMGEIPPVEGGIASHQVTVSAAQLDICDTYSMDYKPVLYDMDGDQDNLEIEAEGMDDAVAASIGDRAPPQQGEDTDKKKDSTVDNEDIPDPIKFRCEDCLREYKWKKDLTAHKKKCKKDPSPKLQCRRCRFMFKTAEEKTDHEKDCDAPPPKKIPGPKRVKCDICDYVCRTQKMKLSHMHNKHDVPFDYSNEDYTVYKCEVKDCNFETLYQFWLEAHQRRHSSDSIFVCEICGQAFKTSVGLQNHCRASHEGQLFSCDQCDKKFVSKTTLRNHSLRVHNKQREFKCSHCPYESFNLATLDAHMHSKHQVPYPENRVSYSCSHCNYITCRKNHYESHMHRHKGEAPFVCKVCGKGFPGRSDLTSHQKWHDAMTDRKHKCPYEGCTYAAILPGRLQDHIRQMHTHKHIKPFKCEMCVYQTNVRGNLLLHLRRTHKVNVEGNKQPRILKINESQPPVSSSQIIAQAMREEGIPLSTGEILDSSGHVVGSTIEDDTANMAPVSEENVAIQQCDVMGMRRYMSEEQVEHGQGHLGNQGQGQMQSQGQYEKNFGQVQTESVTRKDPPNVTVDLSVEQPEQRRQLRPEVDKGSGGSTSLHDLSRSVGPVSMMLPQGHSLPRQVRPPGPSQPHMGGSSVPVLYRDSLHPPASHPSAQPPSHHHGQHSLHTIFPEITQAVKQFDTSTTSSSAPTSSAYLPSSAPPNLHTPLQLPHSYPSPMGHHYVPAPGHLQPPSAGPALYHPYWTQVMGQMAGSSEPGSGQGHVNVIHDMGQL